ncbi:MAG: BMP family ABC transporter substrate-binding protein [Bifidobacteriaceae bacterium]|jgi:basic membrane protein A|nr:BMP family ABC transporter substrate-binding protein [Bifidobacteriaceae bacterium]
MSTKTGKLVAAGATLLMGALALTACGGGGTKAGNGTSSATGEAAETSQAEGATGDHLFIYLTNDPIGVNKFLESGKWGIESAAAKFGGEGKTYEGSTDEANRANLEAAIGEQPDVIVLITYSYTDLAAEAAAANPDQQFVLVDDCPADPPANLHCAVFREMEPSYLLGYEAGLLTKTNKVGSVAALDIPFLHRYTDSFALGAAAANPDVTDKQLFIGGSNPFGDPAKGKEQALAMEATGADQVFAGASGSNGGIFEAAAEKGFTSYGVDVNQCPMAPGAVGDGTIKDVEVVVVNEITKILDGTAAAGSVTSYGLSEGGMDIVSLSSQGPDSGCTVMEHPEVVEQLKTIKQQIIDGEITIPDPTAVS